MSESPWLVPALGMLTGCAVVLTGTVLVIGRRVSRFVRHADEALPEFRQAMQEARDAFRETRHLVHRTNRTSRQLEGVVEQACDAASAALQEWDRLWAKAHAWVGQSFGNGHRAGVEPRRGRQEASRHNRRDAR